MPHDGAPWHALCTNGNAPYGSESKYASCTSWNDATNDAPYGRAANGTNAWNDVISNAWNDDVSYVSGFHATCFTGNLVNITICYDVLTFFLIYEIIPVYPIANHISLLNASQL
jgi:hypothetical protein